MATKKKVTISWSGGKDSAFALYKILASGEYDVVHLHTLFNADNHRVGLHGIHESIIEQQARCLGFELKKLYLPVSDNHDAFTELMTRFYSECKSQNIEAVVFGDIFLEDLRQYRDSMMKEVGLTGIYPLWKLDTKAVMLDFLNVGFKTIICAANASYFQSSHVGVTITENFLQALPDCVDPCGENGEFHSVVYDGPIFKGKLLLINSDIVEHTYQYKVINDKGDAEDRKSTFWFADVHL